jgi:hypothetical protein
MKVYSRTPSGILERNLVYDYKTIKDAKWIANNSGKNLWAINRKFYASRSYLARIIQQENTGARDSI